MLDRRRFLLAATAGALAPLLPNQAAAIAPARPDQALAAALDAFVKVDLHRSPEEATALGLDVGDNAALRAMLAIRSLGQRALDKADTADRLRRLGEIDRAALSGMAAVNYD
ncbi:MAG: DUF885 domain-containing protein, partial [Caulobacteraceae bacterium]